MRVLQAIDRDAAGGRGAGRKFALKCECCLGSDDAGRVASRFGRVLGVGVGDGREIAEVARRQQPGALRRLAAFEQR